MIFDSIKKSIKLRKLSKILGEPTTLSVKGLLSGSEKREKALDELYSLSKEFKYTNKRLEKYKVDKDRFKKIYHILLRAGVGQWVKGHFVVASSLVFGSTLEYILEELEKHSEEEGLERSRPGCPARLGTPVTHVPQIARKLFLKADRIISLGGYSYIFPSHK